MAGEMSDDVPDRVRQECYVRDGFRCRLCGITNAYSYELHHIFYRSQGGPHTHENLILLCSACHVIAHSDKGKYQPLLRELLIIDKPITGLQLLRWRGEWGGDITRVRETYSVMVVRGLTKMWDFPVGHDPLTYSQRV